MPKKPVPDRGGELVYGLEAETADWCLSSGQIAISGMQVVRAIYDPLTSPDAKGGYAPYLAKSVTHDDSYKVWTITLRSGVTFHDGSALTADVVKNNLDAYRGVKGNHNRSSLLFGFALANIATVSVTNGLTVQVTTKVPWVAFPAALYNSGRLGIMAQAQLDASVDDCGSKPIGTGPFAFESWTPGVSLKATRWAKYWQIAPDKKPYPYLDAIEFRPIPSSDARLAGLLNGDLNMVHTSTVSDMAENLPRLSKEGAINLLISEVDTEVAYNMFNTSKAPFDNPAARLAAVQAIDQKRVNDETNGGAASLAGGPFAPGVMGHLDDPGYPKFDPAAATAAVAKLKAEGVDTHVVLVCTTDPTVVRQSAVTKRMLEAAGFEIEIQVEAQEDLIDRVIGGDFQMATFRNQPGEDPDMNHIWWYGNENPVNFGRFDDAELNRLFDAGRSEPSKAKRTKIYEAINRRMVSQNYAAWGWYVPWAVAQAPNVHGILGPPLPDRSPAPSRIVTGHPLIGVWIEKPAAS